MERKQLVCRLSLAGTRILMLVLLAANDISAAVGAPLADIGSAKPDDATQGRLRVSQCVADAPKLDLYVNRQQAVNGGVLQILNSVDTSGYLYLPPATYAVALAPTGQGLGNPFLSSVSVQVAAGHRYTIVVLGQKEDSSHSARIIDETAAYQAIGAMLPDSQRIGHITVNNLKGAPPVHFLLGGALQEKPVAYGDFEAAQWPAFAKGIGLSSIGSPGQVLFNDDGTVFNPPGSDNMDCLFGAYPDNDSRTTPATSLLNPTDFLQRFNDLGKSTGGETPTFNTFLSVLDRAGLREMLNTGGPYLLFAPTDEAFASLPKQQLDTLMGDQTALTDLVRAHVVEGYYPSGSLSGSPGKSGFNRTLTNIRGGQIVLTGGEQLVVNGVEVGSGGDHSMVANGTRLFWTSKLILPSGQVQPGAPSPGMPSTGAGTGPADVALGLIAALALLLVLAGSVLSRRDAGHIRRTARR